MFGLGGSIAFNYLSSNISITNCRFEGGYARYSGGAIVFASDVVNLLIQGNQFVNNQVNPYTGFGGSICFNTAVTDAILDSNYFYKSAAFFGMINYFPCHMICNLFCNLGGAISMSTRSDKVYKIQHFRSVMLLLLVELFLWHLEIRT